MLAFGRIGTGKYHPDEFFERTGQIHSDLAILGRRPPWAVALEYC